MRNVLLFPLLCFVFFIGDVNAQPAINFLSTYDEDNSTMTNPKVGEILPSYLINGTKIFFAGIAVEVSPELKGSEAMLEIWNSTHFYIFNTSVDHYGIAGFTFGLPYSLEGYSYRVRIGNLSTEVREIIVNASAEYVFDSPKIEWITPMVNGTIHVTASHTVEAVVNSSYFIVNATLALSSSELVYSLPAQISGNILRFNLSKVSDGVYSAVIIATASSVMTASQPVVMNVSLGNPKPTENENYLVSFFHRSGKDELKIVYGYVIP